MTQELIKVMLVDDNAQYRDAFKRTLQLEGYEVCEAEDAAQAVTQMDAEFPDVVVTDLQMRTDQEGLELIESIKAADPLMPVIMISAVGSFEEGALATKLGAAHVIHKGRIEEEMDDFLETIRSSHYACLKNRGRLSRVAQARHLGSNGQNEDEVTAIRRMLKDPNVDPYVKSEAYDFITSISESDLIRESEASVQQAAGTARHEEAHGLALERIKEAVPSYGRMREDSRKALLTAEYLYELQGESDALDFTNSIVFSYCFSVESEVRHRLKGNITRFARAAASRRILEACVDARKKRMDKDFCEELLEARRRGNIHFTMDGVRLLILGILKRQDRAQVLGLKDVGIMLLCFGRHYAFPKWGSTIEVSNPLRIKGLDGDDDVIRFAGSLIALQYARNPHVHPQMPKKREQLSVVREKTFNCLHDLGRLQ